MKVFVSWSGEVSNKIGQALADWLPDVIQGTEIFLSSQDIAKGERAARSMWDALDGYEFGLSIVTAQNKSAPWIMFEAGAMMRFPSGRVVPILCNIKRLDISTTPLNSFQCSTLEKKEMFAVVASMNEAAGMQLPKDKLEKSFERWWPDLEKTLTSIDMNEGIATPTKQSDQAAHFERLESGITSLMSMVDRLHKDATEERAIRNRSLQPKQTDKYIITSDRLTGDSGASIYATPNDKTAFKDLSIMLSEAIRENIKNGELKIDSKYLKDNIYPVDNKRDKNSK